MTRLQFDVLTGTALLLVLLLLAPLSFSDGALIEPERVQEYHRRGYQYPLVDYVPNTTGWRDLMSERLAQLEEIPDAGRRYEGFFQTMSSAFVVPNFTEYGFALARAPDALTRELQQAIRDGLPTAGTESIDGVINGPQPPLMVYRDDLTRRVLHELLPYAEEWSGVKLQPQQAYGFRLYRNESQLLMHVDRVETHVLSFIYHIDSSEDAEPWPIFIEDFLGRTHEVILTPGDMLFYESSKCFHGRPRRLNGSWYSSIFVHYYPEKWQEVNHELEVHYSIPPIWSRDPVGEPQHPQLEMVETSMKNPNCPDEWCGVENTVKWSGPGEKGYYIRPDFTKVPFHPRSIYEEESSTTSATTSTLDAVVDQVKKAATHSEL